MLERGDAAVAPGGRVSATSVTPEDAEVMRRHQEAKRLGEVVARVERERTSTGESVRKAAQRMDEFSLVWTEQEGQQENDATDLLEVEGKETLDGYLASLIEATAVLEGLFAPALSTLILNSIDPDYRCKLRHLPSDAVTVERCLAHVDSMRLSGNNRVCSRLARLVVLALLNRRTVRDAREGSGAVPRLRVVPRPDELTTIEAKQGEATTRLTTPSQPMLAAEGRRLEVDAPPGRVIAGFVEVVTPTSWRIDGAFVRMQKGEPLLLVEALDAEREAARMDGSLLVWWKGKPRRLPASSVAPIRRDDYVARTSASSASLSSE